MLNRADALGRTRERMAPIVADGAREAIGRACVAAPAIRYRTDLAAHRGPTVSRRGIEARTRGRT